MAYMYMSGYSGGMSGMGGGMMGADMSHVYRGIWIGGHTALNSSTLMQSGIHNVVNAAMELMDGAGIVDWGDLNRHGIAVQHVPLDDTPAQRLVPPSPALQAAMQFIHECVSSNAPVLVNCAMGVSRSPSVVIAYLMTYQSMSFDEAYRIVSSGRPAANPNPGFVSQLRQLGGGQGPYSRGPYSHSHSHGQAGSWYGAPSAPMPGAGMYMMPGELQPAPYPRAEPWSMKGIFGRLRQF